MKKDNKMLVESRLFNFIDSKNGFALSFLDGSKVINDLAIIHDVKNEGFLFFRDATLSSLQLLNYLKPGESMGFFVDSDNPYFRFKLELNSSGFMRTLLLPENFDELPKIFSGKVRIVKMFPNKATPYQSILEAKAKNFNDVVNDILKDSYQLKSIVTLSEESDQSYMLSKLPDINVDKEKVEDGISLDEYQKNIQDKLSELFKKATSEPEEITKTISDLGLSFLSSKDITFKCNCSRERMLGGILSLTGNHSIEEIFDGKDSLEAKCDYCKTTYLITKDEIKGV